MNRPGVVFSGIPCYILLFMLGLGLCTTTFAHYYNLSECPEEIKDSITAQLIPGLILLEYRSDYLGQIVPHIKMMIDANQDSMLSDAEIDEFISVYKKRLTRKLKEIEVNLDSAAIHFTAVQVNFPTIQQDSLLAPALSVRMQFQATFDLPDAGQKELIIAPKLFFANGTLLINMAREQAQFTPEQEQAIGRVLQIKMHTSQPFRFVSAFPGYVRGNDDLVTISGIFYDQTLLQIEESKYPKMKIKFNVKK